MEDAIVFIKRIREQIHSLYFSVNYLSKNDVISRMLRDADLGILISLERLRMAKGWLGKHLGVLGMPYPYILVTEISDIPAETDVPTLGQPLNITTEKEALALLNKLRSEISSIISQLRNDQEHYYVNKAMDNLQEASMGLGLIIGELRKDYVRKKAGV
jgi:hypothetical protein